MEKKVDEDLATYMAEAVWDRLKVMDPQEAWHS